MLPHDNKKQETIQSQVLDQKLVEAAQNLNLAEIKTLILKGANINNVVRPRSDGRYTEYSYTSLSAACEASFTDENLFINIIQYLLQNGADLNFKMLQGRRSDNSKYSIARQLPTKIEQMQKMQNKVKLIKILKKYGFDLNKTDKFNHIYKNGYQKYRFTFGTKMVDFCYLESRISELKKIFSFDSKKIQQEKSEQLNKMFYILMLEKQNQRHLLQNNIQNQLQQPEEKLEPNLAFVEQLLELGVSPNSQKSEKIVSGGYYRGRGVCQKQQKHNIFHNVIMNNSLGVVQKCLQKGADIKELCTITIKKPSIYPYEWPEDVKKQKIKKNMDYIKSCENKKYHLQNILKQHEKNQNIEQAKECKRKIRELKFSIFKAHRFSIQNELPTTEYKIKKLNCLQIAQALNVDSKIIEILKKASDNQCNKK